MPANTTLAHYCTGNVWTRSTKCRRGAPRNTRGGTFLLGAGYIKHRNGCPRSKTTGHGNNQRQDPTKRPIKSTNPTKDRFIQYPALASSLTYNAVHYKGYIRGGLGGWATCQIHPGTKAACAVPDISILSPLFQLSRFDSQTLVYLLPGLEEI